LVEAQGSLLGSRSGDKVSRQSARGRCRELAGPRFHGGGRCTCGIANVSGSHLVTVRRPDTGWGSSNATSPARTLGSAANVTEPLRLARTELAWASEPG